MDSHGTLSSQRNILRGEMKMFFFSVVLSTGHTGNKLFDPAKQTDKIAKWECDNQGSNYDKITAC